MTFKFIIFFLFSFHVAQCQINIYTDLGSFLIPRVQGGDKFIEKILMRPNIGVEKTNNLKTTSLLFMYKKNHGYGIYYRGFDSNGIRIDLSQKRYFPNNQRMYLEAQFRFELISAKDAFTTHRSPYVDIKSKNLQIGVKIGGRGKYIRKIGGDLSFGIGLGFFKDKETISAFRYNNLLPSQRIKMEKWQVDLDEWNKKIYLLPIPYIQYRLHFNGSKVKKEKVFQRKK
jgi:hypothetical protein